MKDLIQSIVETLHGVIDCKVSYLLRQDEGTFKILSFTGSSNADEFNIVNTELFGASRQTLPEKDTILKTESFQALFCKEEIKDIYIGKIPPQDSLQLNDFILLFSGKEKWFNAPRKKTIGRFITLLSGMCSSYYEEEEDKDTDNGKDLQAELKTLEEKFRLLVETANDLIFSLNSYGYFVTVNNYGALALGYKPEEMIGRHFLEFINENSKSDVALAFQQILKSDQITSFEVIFVDKYGNDIIFEVQGKPTKSDEEIAGLLGIGRDITQRSKDEEKLKDLNSKLIEANRLVSIERDRAKQQISVLEEVNKLKSEFISNISHELRTPLASIVGFSETIASDPEMPKEMIMEFNNFIFSEAKRLAKLINDLLDFAKIEGGRVEIYKSKFDIIKLLYEIINGSYQSAASKGITLTAEVPDTEVLLYADKERIAQVFQNLINNAIKFTDKGGRITVIAQCFIKEFEVIVSDTGIGIPEKDIPNLFQKFYKVTRPGTQIPGIGLGLGLVKQIIDLHKGMITVQSEVNKGTTFIVKLPLK